MKEVLDALARVEKKLERLELIESHLLDVLLPQRKAFMRVATVNASVSGEPGRMSDRAQESIALPVPILPQIPIPPPPPPAPVPIPEPVKPAKVFELAPKVVKPSRLSKKAKA